MTIRVIPERSGAGFEPALATMYLLFTASFNVLSKAKGDLSSGDLA